MTKIANRTHCKHDWVILGSDYNGQHISKNIYFYLKTKNDNLGPK